MIETWAACIGAETKQTKPDKTNKTKKRNKTNKQNATKQAKHDSVKVRSNIAARVKEGRDKPGA